MNISVLILILLVSQLTQAFDYFKQPTFDFPLTEAATQVNINKLIYTTDLMAFLSNQYQDQIKTTNTKATLYWDLKWDKNFIGAGTTLENTKFSIVIYGGQVRAEGSSFELMALTICHEIGHYLGGLPRQTFAGQQPQWSSSEGQADWFAATQCLPKVYNHYEQIHPEWLSINIAKDATEICSLVTEKSRSQCQWVVTTGFEFAQFDQYYTQKYDLQNLTDLVGLNKSALEKPENTLTNIYPTDQCRLDTYIHAAVALKRPSCWFVE